MMLFCNIEPCPPDAEWTTWGQWGECDLVCGGGQRTRERSCEATRRADGSLATDNPQYENFYDKYNIAVSKMAS